MGSQAMVMYEEEFRQIETLCEKLNREANAKAVLLVDKNGQFITSHGEIGDLDTTSLASLTAGNTAATSGLANLIGEREFPNVFLEGETYNLHISIVAQRAILLVMFDKRSSLGLVRLRVKKTSEFLATIFTDMVAKAADTKDEPFAEISDDDIDNLFSE